MYRGTRTALSAALGLCCAATSFVACSDDDVTGTSTGLISPVQSDANVVALTHETIALRAEQLELCGKKTQKKKHACVRWCCV